MVIPPSPAYLIGIAVDLYAISIQTKCNVKGLQLYYIKLYIIILFIIILVHFVHLNI